MTRLRVSLFTRMIAAILLLGAVAAQAGTTLRLRQGEVQTNNPAQMNALAAGAGEFQTRYFVVQFKDKITAHDRNALRALGARIYNYIPDDALLIKAASGDMQPVVQMPTVQAVLPFAKEWRRSPDLPSISVFNSDLDQTVIVRLTGEEEMSSVQQQLAQMSGVQVMSAEGQSLLVHVTGRNLDSVSGAEGVLWVQPYIEMQTMALPMQPSAMADQPPGQGDFSDLSGKESGTVVMNFPAAWGRGYDGTGQTASMADTGLDTGDKTTLWKDFSQVKEGQVYGMYSKSWEDPMGHGTHVSGSIVSNGTGSKGLMKGGAFGAQFVVQSMWSPMLSNLTVPPDLKQMFQKAFDSGARIHSNSWGSPRNLGVYDANAQQVDEYMWNNPTFLVLFAAGNSGIDKDKTGRISEGSVSTPGTAKNALTVGASENLVLKGGIQKKLGDLKGGLDNWGVEPLVSSLLSDNINAMAMFSSRGPALDGRRKPEVVAPGTNILSNCSHNKSAEVLWGKYNNDYCFSGGTSMATPLTAGAATVVRQYLVQAKKIADPSAALVKNVLMHTAYDMYPGHFGEVGKAKGQELLVHRPDNNQGFGRVDMDAATKLDASVVIDETVGVTQDHAKSIDVQVGQGGKLLATLVYTDAPGAPNAAKVLVNDLDLEVTGPQGASVGSPQDRVNNNEYVELKGLPAGTYTVTVKGYKIPQGKNGAQPFALVVSTDVPNKTTAMKAR